MNSEKPRKRRLGRPTIPPEDRRSERISFGVTRREKAAFLINASTVGLTGNAYARQVLCGDTASTTEASARSDRFELIDGLSRIGADLARLRFIAEQTGTVPLPLDAVIARLDLKLDRLIVASRLADELNAHRSAITEIADKLDGQREMTSKARGMITTFDRVVNKVLSE